MRIVSDKGLRENKTTRFTFSTSPPPKIVPMWKKCRSQRGHLDENIAQRMRIASW